MPSNRTARILIVDDSAVMRSLLRSVIACDKRLEVVGTANDGASALRVMESVRPDLLLLDVEMPGLDGLGTLKQMRSQGKKVPVIMCSSLTQRGAKVTIEALANGAADYVAKPSGQPSRDAAVQTLARDLIPKILALTESVSPVPPISSVFVPLPPASLAPRMPGLSLPAIASYSTSNQLSPPEILLIGLSTGGPAALDVLLPALPASFPLPVLIVQHMPELFTKLLAERLNTHCALRVLEASAGESVQRGVIYIARGDWHLEVVQAISHDRLGAQRRNILRLTQEPPEHFCRPAVDVLLRSAVSVYGANILAVILTGMGSDGLAGCRLIREHNGTVLAQDQETSAVWGMPGAVAQAGLAHRVLPLPAIAPEILRLTSRGQREAFELRESIV
jgi:two-component system chemotaxis response regulator CheB